MTPSASMTLLAAGALLAAACGTPGGEVRSAAAEPAGGTTYVVPDTTIDAVLDAAGVPTALLACLQEDLACAIAGIPVVDFARIYWRHGPRLQLDYLEHVGIGVEHYLLPWRPQTN